MRSFCNRRYCTTINPKEDFVLDFDCAFKGNVKIKARFDKSKKVVVVDLEVEGVEYYG